MNPNRFYLNPVIKRDFADPFVFKYLNEYYAVCTGFWHDGGVFGLMRSRDLVNWTDCGSAINPAPFPEAPCYWAPEIFCRNGKFYLYYSVGNEENMRIRVAVSDQPDNGYIDAGRDLTSEKFAIDAHVFVDDKDNSHWLFYATDFLDYANIGTGTVCDRMISPFELAGEPQPVTRAKYDWQVYDPVRASKGNVRWHTIEGSTVLKRKGVYYQMFSGGNWQNISYGVSYATTRDIEQPEEWTQIADGEITFPILRTIPEKVIGPGHNSVVRAPDNRQLYCVYHRWAADLSGRQMAIDPLDFAGERMLVLGASYEPQFAPNNATVADFFENRETLQTLWQMDAAEDWTIAQNAVVSSAESDNAELVCNHKTNAFVAEVSARAIEFDESGGYGFCLKNDREIVLRCLILPETKQIEVSEQDEYGQAVYSLPGDFDAAAFHLWRVEADGAFANVRLDEANFVLHKQLKYPANNFALATQTCAAAFAGFALTDGFETDFDWEKYSVEPDLSAHGWTNESAIGRWRVADALLHGEVTAGETKLFKNARYTDFELVVNARLDEMKIETGGYGFVLRDDENEILFAVKTDNAKHFLNVSTASANERFDLPDDFSIDKFQQFRLRASGDELVLQHENNRLGQIRIERSAKQFGILLKDVATSFDMVRITRLTVDS